MSVPDDDYLLHLKLNEQMRINKENSKEKYCQESRRHLQEVAAKKMQTTFIGSLDKFERAFGFLWGDSKGELNDDDKELLKLLDDNGFDTEYWKELWMETREKVLDNGNAQLKALKKEINNYNVSWNKHKTIFKPRNT